MPHRLFVAALLLAVAPAVLLAQAVPTATRRGDLQVGAGYSDAASDYGNHFTGFNIYGDFDFLTHFGAEANFHFVKEGGNNPDFSDLYEKTYEIGARYFRTYGRISPYAKIMIGRGVFNYPRYDHANLAYNLYAPGIGVDVHVKPYLNIRGDFEYQQWPSFPPSGLSPAVLSIGAAYHFR